MAEFRYTVKVEGRDKPITIVTDEAFSPDEILEAAGLKQPASAKTKPGKSIREGIVEGLKDPTTLGAAGGSVIGTIVGGPGVGTVAGTMIGAGVGSTFKSVVQEDIKDPAVITERAMKEATMQGLLDAATFGAAKAGKGLIKAVGKPIQESVFPAAKEAIKAFGEEVGGVFLPSQVTSNFLLDFMENISAASFIGGGKIAKFKRGQQELIKQWTEKLGASFGQRASSEQIGELVQGIVSKRYSLQQTAVKAAYRKLDKLVAAETKRASDAVFRAKARGLPSKGIVDEGLIDAVPIERFISSISKKRAIKLSSIEGETIITRLKDLGTEKLTFEQAQGIRSFLLQIARERGGQQAGLARSAARVMDNEMSKAATRLHGDALQIWRGANVLRREQARVFENRTIRELFKAAPEKIVDSIKPGSTTSVRRMMEALGEEGTKDLQSGFVQKILRQASEVGVETTQEIQGGRLLSILDNTYNETMEVLFSPLQKQNIRNVAVAARLASKKSEGPGGMLVQMTQAGGMIGFLTKGMTTPAAFILIAPAAMAKMLISPTGSRFLSAGMTHPVKANTPTARKLFGNLIAQAIKLGGRAAISVQSNKALPTTRPPEISQLDLQAAP